MIKKIRKFINSCPEWLAWGVFHAVVSVPFVIGVSIVAAHIFALALIIWWKSNDY